jgi:hypothetical protein
MNLKHVIRVPFRFNNPLIFSAGLLLSGLLFVSCGESSEFSARIYSDEYPPGVLVFQPTYKTMEELIASSDLVVVGTVALDIKKTSIVKPRHKREWMPETLGHKPLLTALLLPPAKYLRALTFSLKTQRSPFLFLPSPWTAKEKLYVAQHFLNPLVPCAMEWSCEPETTSAGTIIRDVE